MVVCTASNGRQKINSRMKRKDVRQSHAYCFEELDQLFGEQLVFLTCSFDKSPRTRPSTDAQSHQGRSRAAGSLSLIAAMGAYHEGVTTSVINGQVRILLEACIIESDTCFTSCLAFSVVLVTQDRSHRERNYPRANHLLLGGEKPEEDC